MAKERRTKTANMRDQQWMCDATKRDKSRDESCTICSIGTVWFTLRIVYVSTCGLLSLFLFWLFCFGISRVIFIKPNPTPRSSTIPGKKKKFEQKRENEINTIDEVHQCAPMRASITTQYAVAIVREHVKYTFQHKRCACISHKSIVNNFVTQTCVKVNSFASTMYFSRTSAYFLHILPIKSLFYWILPKPIRNICMGICIFYMKSRVKTWYSSRIEHWYFVTSNDLKNS